MYMSRGQSSPYTRCLYITRASSVYSTLISPNNLFLAGEIESFVPIRDIALRPLLAFELDCTTYKEDVLNEFDLRLTSWKSNKTLTEAKIDPMNIFSVESYFGVVNLMTKFKMYKL